MNLREAAVSFVAYSILGWVLDSAVRTVLAGTWTSDNGLGVPFSPLYGCGALAALWFAKRIVTWRWWQQLLTFSVVLAVVEYIGGALSLALHGRRLWDYTWLPFDLHGHTDPIHALAWGVMGMALTRVFQPWIHARLERHSR